MEKLEQLFWEAVALSPGERHAFLLLCDPGLRPELERMLEADGRAGTFLERPLPDVLADDVPQGTVASWTLLERVGEGGLGVVYRAECQHDGVRLESAIKILRPGFDTGRFHERFVQERQILAQLDHPGIVRLLDCGADRDGRSFLVMEFVQGEPLDVHIGRTNPPSSRRLELFEMVCEAVRYLHSQLVVHGDIKPSNVIVTADGRPKLLDFGAACLLRSDAGARGELTRMLLTPRYASPEQKRGEGPSVPSDVYSLGRLLQEILPVHAGHSDLRCIVGRATAEHPADRYLSVADLLEDLRRLREGLPLRARRATAAYVARRFLRRNWEVALLAALLVVSLAGGWWRAERASRRASAAAAEAWRQRQAAVTQERRAVDNEAIAARNAREAILNAERLDALVGDLLDDEDADPNIVSQQEATIESSLRRSVATLESFPGVPRWRELSIAWRRLAMILVHRGAFAAAEMPIRKAREAADGWFRAQPSAASQRNVLLVNLCELRLARQSGDTQHGYRLAHEAISEFRTLPASMKAKLNGSVWLESARLAIARELIDRNRLDSVPALLTEVVGNSHARGLTQTRNLAVANLVWSFRRLNRLDDARRWCQVSKEWQVAESRIGTFCAEPLAAFSEADALFPVVQGVLSAEDLQTMLSRISQLIQDRHEDPHSFPLNIALGRAYARLTEHYLAAGQTELARPAMREATTIRDALVAADANSPVVLNFSRRVDTLFKALAGR
jgi:hypothetical protein